MFGGIPFEHFAQGGGGGGGGFRPSSQPADTTKLYETLEVEKTATSKEIKKAYFRLSKLHHPDRDGGDAHKFKEIAAAYEILSDDAKRQQYDAHGLEGVDDDDGARAARGEDLFSMFFGGSRGNGAASGPRKGPAVHHPIKVSLEDLYNGKTVKLAVNRKVIIGSVATCTACRGQGAVLELRQIGPGMVTQMQRTCPECQGQGSTAETKNERKVLEVHIAPGMADQSKVTFAGAADEVPGLEPGDVHFIIQEKEHDLFKRKGADLLVTKDISLNQALCGFSWKIKHLDQRDIVIATRPGQVIQCEVNDTATGRTLPYIAMVPNEGMPSQGNPFVKGNLYVAFHVKFPATLAPDIVAQLRTLLPDPNTAVALDDTTEEHFLDEADLRLFGKGGASTSSNEYDSDDERGGGGAGGRGVQCQQS